LNFLTSEKHILLWWQLYRSRRGTGGRQPWVKLLDVSWCQWLEIRSFFWRKNREWNIQISRFDFWGFCRFWCGISWDYHGILWFWWKDPNHGFIGKPIPKTSWPVLLSRCGCGSLPWRRTNWAAGLREPIGIWSIWNSSWICWNWSDNSIYLLSRWRVQSWNLQSDVLGWFLQQKPVYPRTFCNWNSRWLVSCFSFSDHPGLKTSSPSHWSPNQWLLEISILEKPQEMGKLFSIGVKDLSPLESVRLRPGRFDDRFSCVSLFFCETLTLSKTLSIFFRKWLICFFLMWGWRICFPIFFFMLHHFLRFPCEPWSPIPFHYTGC